MSITEICLRCGRQKEFKDRAELLNHAVTCKGRRLETTEEKKTWKQRHLEKLKLKRLRREQKNKERIQAKFKNSKQASQPSKAFDPFRQIERLKSLNASLMKEVKTLKGQREISFYDTWDWCQLRLKVLNIYGAVCMVCKSTEHIQVDHIKPRSRYRHLELEIENLQVLCKSCNMGKSNLLEKDYRPKNWEDLLRRAGIPPISDSFPVQ